ncbi:MAG TPA: hypothetical protein VGO56_05980 [Pyrinomonadaceae bacterium]|jgi:hypothetical protein|nr:hypothetical protein [Pyrinomonadaceae bacterium]
MIADYFEAEADCFNFLLTMIISRQLKIVSGILFKLQVVVST